jgi:plasmid stabilization system protein ParE
MPYIITTKAKKDLDEIWFYIAKDNVTAANKLEDQFLEAFELITTTPQIGTQRKDLLDVSVRFWVVHSYYIIYNPDTNPLQILRIMSSYKDLKNNF